MPLVRVDLSKSRASESKKSISDSIHEALIAAFEIPPGDRFQIFSQHPSDDLIFDPSFLGVTRTDVVFVQILMVQKHSREAKLAFYEELAQRLAPAGIAKGDLFISVVENQSEDWTAGER